MKRISLVFLLFSLCWMSTIFYFSSQNGDDSTEESISVGLFVGKTFIPDFKKWDEDKQIEFASKIDHPIRKMAHATEYAILGIFIYFTYKNRDNKWFFIAWLICILYASSDEFHQLFVLGRSGQISDVCLDSMGSLIGIGLAKAFSKFH